MKKIILSLVAAMSLMTSCNNFLDIVPKGKDIITEAEDYVNLIEELDPAYRMDYFWYVANEVSWYNLKDMENYADPVRSISFFWDESKDRAQYLINDDLYNRCYQRISRYNIMIENIMESNGDIDTKKLGMAQAKIMRAYNYFFLVNTYAKMYNPETSATDLGVIIHEKFDLEAVGVQHTVQQVYDLIERDISDALADLPIRPVNSFRPGKAFGYALKAKVHLYKQEFEEVIKAAQEAMNVPNHKLWDMNAMYKSTLVQFPFLEQMPQMWPSLTTFSNQDPEHLLYQFAGVAGDPSPNMVRRDIIELMDTTADIRYLTLFAYTMPPRPTAEQDAEQYAAMMVNWNCGGIRLSDVYLMQAEAYARIKDTKNAMDVLNRLRVKRILEKEYKPLVATTPEEAFQHVRNERRCELMLTYNGFFDMRRYTTQLNETVTKTYLSSDSVRSTYTLKPDSRFLVFPFPQNAMETSNLTQNTK